MRETRLLMGMPVTIEVVDGQVSPTDIERVYTYLHHVDETFSTYKETSEISQLNAGKLKPEAWSADMREVLAACERTKQETHGYFDIAHNGTLDPSGYVKGWAIQNAAALLCRQGFRDYYVEAGGDLQVSGHSAAGRPWVIGIRNPFNHEQIVKRVELKNEGMATSGTYIKGQHIYNPLAPGQEMREIVSLTVIGPKVVDADRYATAAFAMGVEGVAFIASLKGFEGYQIDALGTATFTPGFSDYALPDDPTPPNR